MKKIIFIAITLVFANTAMGQYNAAKTVWLDFGANIELGNSNIINKNLRKDNNLRIQSFNSAEAYGAALAVRFPNQLSIIAEGAYANYSQLYNVMHPKKSYNYNKKLKLNTINTGLYFRYTSFYGIYGEAGSNVLLMNRAVAKFKGNYPASIQTDQRPRYSNFSVQAMTGLGIRLFSSIDERLLINMGVRTYFHVTDLMAQTIDSPASDDVAYIPDYPNSQASRLINVMVHFGINFSLASFEKTTSGKVRVNVF